PSAVPVRVESGRQLLHDGPGRDDVHVAEVELRIHAEVRIGDVAATHDGDLVVGDEELVVHAVIQAAELQKEIDAPAEAQRVASADGVVELDLDVRVRVEHRDREAYRAHAGRNPEIDHIAFR